VTHSVPRQAFALHGLFPEVKAKLTVTQLVWTGPIQPTPASRVYVVRIAYMLGHFPRVRVLSPDLETRPGERLPHVYGDGSLCLHLEDEWSPDMLIVDTTLPWTAEWLINYEIWKATGEWHGGGQWPPPRRPTRLRQAPRPSEAKSPAGPVSKRR
jgi:hypothetical protein